MYHYPSELLLKQSQDGNLFALHIVSEGKVLHDSLGFFSGVKKAFKFKETYNDEILDASLILRFFLNRPQLVSRKSSRKRLIWAIRTILIARNAELRRSCFSSSNLTSFSNIPELKDIIDNRNASDPEINIKVARRVLSKFGYEDLGDYAWPIDKRAQRELMSNRGGIVADTLRFVQPAGLIKKAALGFSQVIPAEESFIYPD
jgi:hypothetical protein